jgi:hypothetical protein
MDPGPERIENAGELAIIRGQATAVRRFAAAVALLLTLIAVLVP